LLGLTQQHKYYYYTDPTDLRKGFDGLSGLIYEELGMSPTNGGVYIFINKNRDKMKMLVWEPGGFMLYYKRLESGTFELPHYDGSDKKLKLSWQSLRLCVF